MTFVDDADGVGCLKFEFFFLISTFISLTLSLFSGDFVLAIIILSLSSSRHGTDPFQWKCCDQSNQSMTQIKTKLVEKKISAKEKMKAEEQKTNE